MKKILAVFLVLILAFSAVSFSALAEETSGPNNDPAASGAFAGYIPPHPYYSPGEIRGTTGGGTKADPIIVDTFDELKKALEFPLDGLYIRCDTCQKDMGLDYIGVDSYQGSATSSFCAIEVRYDKNLTLNAQLDCRSSRIDAPFLDSLIEVLAYLRIDGSGSILGTFSALSVFRNSIFTVYSPGVLELNGITVEGVHRENNLKDPTYARAVWVDSGCGVFNSGVFKGIGYANLVGTWENSPNMAVRVGSGAHAIVNGGTFQCTKSRYNYGISMKKNADAVLAGGTFYGVDSEDKMLSTFLKSNFAYRKVSNSTTFNGSSVKQTEETLRVDYTGSGLRPTEQLSRRQITQGVGYEWLHFTPPDDNTWYDSPLEYSIDGDGVYVGNACYLDYAGVDAEAYDLYDSSDLLMQQRSYYAFSSDFKPIRVKFYLTAQNNCIFDKKSVILINGQSADLEIIDGKHAIASAALTYTDSDLVVDNIALKGSFVPTAGLSASSYDGKLDQYVNCDDSKCEVTNSWIGESGRYDDRYMGTLAAGNTYYMWLEIEIYDPYFFGVDLTYSFYDRTGKSNPSSYSKNYGRLMGDIGGNRAYVSVPFVVPAQSADPMLRGTVTSYLSSTDTVTVQLLQGTTVKKSTTVKGNTASYSITNVPAGTYTLRVSKKNHAARDYTVKINGDCVQNAEIRPIGDVAPKAGVVNIRDVNALYNHVMETVPITDAYLLKCGDVNNKNGVNIRDVNALYNHVMETALLY